jgi:hypothetical protein
VTSILEELDLLGDSSLKFVSSFHKVKIDSKKIINGGIFLSVKKIKKLKNSLVLYDKSRDIKKILSKNNLVSLEFSSRQMSPFKVHQLTLNKFDKYLVDCKKELQALNSKVDLINKRLVENEGHIKTRLLFFLGKIKSNRLPDLLMLNDGPVKFLIDKVKIKSYPSTLAYLPWSNKILKELGTNVVYIGLEEGSSQRVEKVSDRSFNLYFPGVLSPGLSQIKFLGFFMNKISELKI